MKASELKTILTNQYDREQLIHLAVAMYKIIPKAKKEYHEIDALIFNPLVKEVEKAKKQAVTKGEIDWNAEAKAIDSFLEYARGGHFFGKSSFVTSKEQSNWRFTVRKWVKDLTNPKFINVQPELKGELMYKLYTIVGEDYSKDYFPSDDAFRSVGISNLDFYRQTLMLLSTQNRHEVFLERAINAIIDLGRGHDYLFVSFADIIAEACTALNLTTEAIIAVEKRIAKIDKPDPTDRRARSNDNYYQKQAKLHLAEIGFSIHAAQQDYDAALSFFHTHFTYYHNSEEIKLYVLVDTMVHYKFPTHYLIEQIDSYMAKGVKPRESTMKLYKKVKQTGELPNAF